MIEIPGKYFAIENNKLITTNLKKNKAKLAELDEFFAREGFFTSAASTLFINNWYRIRWTYENRKNWFNTSKNKKAEKKHIDNIENFISDRYKIDLNKWLLDENITGKKKKAYPILEGAFNGYSLGVYTFCPIKLFLGRFDLTRLPDCLGAISQIGELHLNHNCLKNLPGNIGDLYDLTLLSVSYNQLEELPASFKNLSTLRVLNLDHNPDLKLSEDVFMNFKRLEKLSLGNTSLKSIPQGIQFSNLKELHLHQNKLTEFPDFPENNKLTVLNLNDNLIEKIPKKIATLVELTHLYLGSNKIRKISKRIRYCTGLCYLNISGNFDLKDLPQSLSDLKLSTIYFEDTQIPQNTIESILKR